MSHAGIAFTLAAAAHWGSSVHRSRLLRLVTLMCTAGFAMAAEGPEWQNWESDVTESMGIGPSLTGYRRVELRCASDHMLVEVEMEDDFDGVLYARGAFHSKEAPCFQDASGGRNFTLRLPFAKCNTRDIIGPENICIDGTKITKYLQENNIYSNTIVIQHDDELIMPGDAAFKLECNFHKPREYTVSTDLDTVRDPIVSKIVLEDADPAAESKPQGERLTATSDSSTVIFIPQISKLLRKEEL